MVSGPQFKPGTEYEIGVLIIQSLDKYTVKFGHIW